ncbi:gamma-type small acid-soluble spore protein [Microbacteriaceae bacterium 4G12]
MMNNKNYNKTTSGASVQRTSQQGAYGTEFATETDAQSVRQANAQSQAKKAQASSMNQSQQ